MYRVLIVVLLLTSCTSTNYSNRYYTAPNENATFQNLLEARYVCLQETVATVSSSSASVTSTQGQASSSSRQLPNCSAYRACLAARGWIRESRIDLDDPRRPYGFHVPSNLAVSCSN